MKRLLTLFLAIALFVPVTLALPAVVAADPGVTIYDQNEAGWKAAVVIWQTEDFSDTTLNPGLSVVSDLGHVDTTNGVWWDRLVVSPPTTTTWQFDTPLFGFGGTWDSGTPGGPGASIEVSMDGSSWTDVGTIPRDYVDKFWGFVSSEPFTKVKLESGTTSGWCETYELDNMVYSTFPVDIDIKPMSDPNSINLKSKGVIPVAILTTEYFDATTVDGTTVMFAGAGPTHDLSDPAVVADHQHDVDLDGDIDYVFHFRIQDTNIEAGDEEATLTGNTLVGMLISGSDSIRTVPPK